MTSNAPSSVFGVKPIDWHFKVTGGAVVVLAVEEIVVAEVTVVSGVFAESVSSAHPARTTAMTVRAGRTLRIVRP